MYARRRRVLVLSVVGFVLSIIAIANGGEPQNANSFDFESARGFTLISDQLPKSGVNFTLILGDSRRSAADPAFHREVTAALAPLGRRPSRRRDPDGVHGAGGAGRADGVRQRPHGPRGGRA